MGWNTQTRLDDNEHLEGRRGVEVPLVLQKILAAPDTKQPVDPGDPRLAASLKHRKDLVCVTQSCNGTNMAAQLEC
jgi:hypothetical protein